MRPWILLALLLLTQPAQASEPATEAARKVLETIDLVEEKLTETKYQHKTLVKLGKGIFLWDCSGMAEWIVGRAAPLARKSLPAGHPSAKMFYKVVSTKPTDEPKKGWIRVGRPDEIRPGDVFTWLKPEFWKKRKNTGHVGFVVDTPWKHPEQTNVWVMRIADATRYPHEDDTRVYKQDSGYGTGTMAFLFEDDGTPEAYGWYGSAQSPGTFVPTKIAFGRVVK
jgi:hypothetical protein